MPKLIGYKSPGRKVSADKARAMTPTMNIRHVPLVIQEDLEFYKWFLESKKYEGLRDLRSKAKFNNSINKMRTRWAFLTKVDELVTDFTKNAKQVEIS